MRLHHSETIKSSQVKCMQVIAFLAMFTFPDIAPSPMISVRTIRYYYSNTHSDLNNTLNSCLAKYIQIYVVKQCLYHQTSDLHQSVLVRLMHKQHPYKVKPQGINNFMSS